ncbi:MAG: SMC-Scp complex subunit ScpB [Acidobacteriaceae bacterium]
MSLKAKIEAIIYAAEEPVTLAQLTGLLTEEATAELEKQAAEAAAQAQAEAEAAQVGSEVPPAPAMGETAPEALAADTVAELPTTEEIVPAESKEEASEAAAELQAAKTAAPLLADVEAAEKKAAREQERKVRDLLRQTVDALISDYARGERGMEIREVAGGYRMGTKPEYHDSVRSFVKSLKPPMKLSLQALETLAVVAYKQPVTAPEVGEIRGVDSGGVLGSLISRKLVTTAGRKQVIGRPILYKTTKEFLLRFGLKDLSELPSIEEFEKMAGELAEQEGLPLTDGFRTDEAASEAMHSGTAELDAPVEDAAALLATEEDPTVETATEPQPDSEESQVTNAEATEAISAPETEESKANA